MVQWLWYYILSVSFNKTFGNKLSKKLFKSLVNNSDQESDAWSDINWGSSNLKFFW